MTFYIDSFEADMNKYESKFLYSSKSFGVVFNIFDFDNEGIASFVDPSFTVTPGTLTSVKINKQLRKRLPEPYGKCGKSNDDYSYNRCVVDCSISHYLKYCNCVFLPNLALNVNLSCNYFNTPQPKLIEMINCVYSSAESVAIHCSACYQRFSEVKYTTELSYTKWPLPYQYRSLYKELIEPKPYSYRFKDFFGSNKSLTSEAKELIQDNFAKIDFDLNFQSYYNFVEVPKYTASSFIGTLGGALNMWTGITVAVVIEIIELFINMTCLSSVRKNTNSIS